MRHASFRAARLCLAAAVLSAAPLASAEAQHYPRRRHGHAIAGGIAGGIIGGLAAGAIISSVRPGPVYAAPVHAPPAPLYVEPHPVYAEPEPVYVPTCHIVRKKVWIDDYAWTYRRYRVCD
jgi:hypothetical protein